MKNNTNIYDIDGEIIRKAGDNHQFTIEEAQERIDKYTKKIEEIDKNDPKIPVYQNYIANLRKYIFNLYSMMTPDQIKSIFESNVTKETTESEINTALNELKEEIEEESTTPVESERPKSQEDMLVERDGEGVIMDEYTDFEEV